MVTRRERLRAELIRDIKATALAHLREHGADGLSLRAVARDLGVSAPGLYRYYSGRDDLLTALIADSYHDLADHLLVAVGADAHAPPADRLLVVCHAYRAWARSHPNEFGLIYGDPIPGYAAPEGGETVAASRRAAGALVPPIMDAWADGDLRVPEALTADLGDGATRLRDDIASLMHREIPVGLAAYILSAWASLHGLVSLEVFGQFDWIYPDGAEALFDAAVRANLAAVGLHPTI